MFDQLRIHLLLNLSRCKRKMLDYNEAIKLATEVIANHPTCYEAFHARAKASHAAGHLDQALHDLTQAVRVAPQNRELHKILIGLKDEIHQKTAVSNQSTSDYKDSCSSFEGSMKI